MAPGDRLLTFLLPGTSASEPGTIADNFRKASLWLGLTTLLLGCMGLLRTAAGLFPHPLAAALMWFPRQPTAALLCFFLVGVGVLSVRSIPQKTRVLQSTLGLLAFGVGFFSVGAQSAGSWQMDVLTAWSILLLGFSLMAGGSRMPVIGYARQLAAFAVFCLCGLVLVGYAYDVQDAIEGLRNRHDLQGFLHMPWTSALAGLAAAHALLFQHPNFGLMRVLTGRGFGSHIFRRVLPATLLLLLGIGWLIAAGEDLNIYPPAFGESLYTILAITGFSGVFLLAANYLNRLDAERRDQEKILRRDRQELQDIVDTIPSLICVKDVAGVYQTVNKSFCQTKGKPTDFFLGKSVFDVYPRETAVQLQKLDQEAIRKGEPTERVEVSLEGDGKMYFAVRLPMRDPEGHVYGLCGVYMDITDLKRQEDEIQALNASLRQKTRRQEAANQELEAFSYSVSHDLRAPLRHISGFGQLLSQRSREALDEKSRHYLDVILSSVGRMGNLIDDLLSFSRANKTELAWRRVPMEELVAEVRSELPGGAGAAAAWDVGLLPDVEGDPAMLRQVWTNLLSNAVKYSGKNPAPRIEIHCVPNGEDEMVFSVRDNGAGFDMRYADKLFGVFQRLHSSQEYEGTGIGLALVRRILERHGGRIWAESSPGHGAAFHFAMPVNRAAAGRALNEQGAMA